MRIARLASLASLASLLVALTSAGVPAPAVSNGEALVTVTFAHPESYTDLRLSCVSTDADGRSLRSELERFLAASAAPLVPAGQRLEITVTNIDMAGDLESWRGSGRCDVRIMKDTYPPRIDLAFRLVDEAGKEQALLGEWRRRELGRGPAS